MIDAEYAFTRARRGSRLRRLRTNELPVYGGPIAGAGRGGGLREIPLEAISGTLEPSRASMFDRDFRPARAARGRWQRVWLAEQRGCPLPPISVLPAGEGYVVRDGHHRVSVARARGAITIDATVDAAA